MEAKPVTVDQEAAALIAEAELLNHLVHPSGGEDGRKYEIYASRCPTSKPTAA